MCHAILACSNFALSGTQVYWISRVGGRQTSLELGTCMHFRGSGDHFYYNGEKLSGSNLRESVGERNSCWFGKRCPLFHLLRVFALPVCPRSRSSPMPFGTPPKDQRDGSIAGLAVFHEVFIGADMEPRKERVMDVVLSIWRIFHTPRPFFQLKWVWMRNQTSEIRLYLHVHKRPPTVFWGTTKMWKMDANHGK